MTDTLSVLPGINDFEEADGIAAVMAKVGEAGSTGAMSGGDDTARLALIVALTCLRKSSKDPERAWTSLRVIKYSCKRHSIYTDRLQQKQKLILIL